MTYTPGPARGLALAKALGLAPARAGAYQRALMSAGGLDGADGLSFAALLASRSRQRLHGAERANLAGAIRGIDQTSVAEYESVEQARRWGGSSCSAAALAAVLRGRGVPVRIADVLRAMGGSITPELGLVSRPGLVAAARRFGLDARDDVTSFEALARATASGQPVLADVTSRRFPEGHWLVVLGIDGDQVRVADSSGYDLRSIPRDEFLATWSGRGIRIASQLTPLRTAGRRVQP